LNRIVQSFKRWQSRPKYEGRDSIDLGDEKLQFEEKPKMPVQVELNQQQFDHVIRQIKNASIDRAKLIRTATHSTLKRLKTKRDVSKAVSGIPKGSDQGNVGTILTWLERVGPNDKKAIEQVVSIDATAVMRMG